MRPPPLTMERHGHRRAGGGDTTANDPSANRGNDAANGDATDDDSPANGGEDADDDDVDGGWGAGEGVGTDARSSSVPISSSAYALDRGSGRSEARQKVVLAGTR